MAELLDDRALDVLFRQVRTFTKWQPRPVTDETLHDPDQRPCLLEINATLADPFQSF